VGRGSSLVGPCAWAVIIASNLRISAAMFPCNSALSAAASACVKPYVVVPFGTSRAGWAGRVLSASTSARSSLLRVSNTAIVSVCAATSFTTFARVKWFYAHY
jgi:hypothetical protein